MPNIEIDSKKGLVQKSGPGGHLKSVGPAPTLVVTSGGGTCAISGTDTVGTLTFSGAFASGNTVVVNFSRPFSSAPQVLISGGTNITAAGASIGEISGLAVTESGFTLTCSGTCADTRLSYLVIETSAS